MADIFLDLLNLSITASWLVLAILVIRFVFPKAPKWVLCLLWGMVGLRLICPVSIESLFSLVPNTQTIPDAIMLDSTPAIDSGISAINNAVNPVISQVFTPEPGASANPLQIWIPVIAVLWLAGMAAMLLYTALTYCRLRLRLRTAVRLEDNIYQSETVTSPFVLGLIRPRIYLPFSIEEAALSHVLSREQAHIRRGDHWWKPMGFCLLSVYWFNPVLWVAYILLCRDIEAACDEKVVAAMSQESRRAYSEALLSCALRRRSIAACPLAFGETGVKARIRKVMNYKRPTFWVLALSVVLCVTAAVCFLTVPTSSGVRSVTLSAVGADEAVLQIRYADLHSYSVELLEETDREYAGDGIIPYDGALGEYRIIIRLGDAVMGKDYSKTFLEKYPVGQIHELTGTSKPLRMKPVCPDDSCLVIYIGADVPLAVEENETILPDNLRGTISIHIRLHSIPEVPEAVPVPTESNPTPSYQLTLDDVIRLSQKRRELTPQDFFAFDCITFKPYNTEYRIYRIDDTFWVVLYPQQDSNDNAQLPYIRLCTRSSSACMLTEDIEAFIRRVLSPEDAIPAAPLFGKGKLAKVTGFILWNSITHEETSITDPEDVEQLRQLLAKLSPAAPYSTPPTDSVYTLQLVEGTTETDFICFGAGNRFYHSTNGGYVYTRYALNRLDIDDVAQLLSSFEQTPFDWFSEPQLFLGTQNMTEADVLTLSHKGYGLTWRDLAPYRKYPIEAGYEFPIRDGCVLRVIDQDTTGIPKGVYYVPIPIGTCFEIRNANIQGYLELHSPEMWHQRITDAITDYYTPDPALIHAVSYVPFPSSYVIETPQYYGSGLYHGIGWSETVYLLAMCKTYRQENGNLLEVSKDFAPMVLYYQTDDVEINGTRLNERVIPEGSDLARILAQFPCSDNALSPEEYEAALDAECDRLAMEKLPEH